MNIQITEESLKPEDFEKFHRKFLALGFGANFIFFIVKSISNSFIMGSKITYEVISKEGSSGIPVDHPKNPATILANMGEGFLRTYQNCIEYNALTNMGLCLFQVNFCSKKIFSRKKY